ncbi:MAG: SPOR domain-containing protein [Proteobacteria bacterium]|nr:SPOR domain-containing protein [Pseudomonadota bacterium]MBU4472306.1 SPOR domain-containing protein [Pseudomonadota bacterium]MCG2752002.1 SPOR domain-containing protein [Desulfobacteraceae bacterium]
MKQNVKKRSYSDQPLDGVGRTKRKLPLYWIGLLCFSSFWMFGLGILVGRGSVDITFDTRPLQKELAAITERLQKKEKQDLEEYAGNLDNKAELDFYEELKEVEPKEKPEALEKTEEVAGIQSEDIPVKKSLAKATKAKIYLQPNEADDPAEPEETQSPAEIKEDKPEDIKFHWTVQVSSVKDPAAAERMVAKLKTQGYSAYSVKAETPGVGVWYRVRVGPYKDKGMAETQMSELKRTGYDAFMISL